MGSTRRCDCEAVTKESCFDAVQECSRSRSTLQLCYIATKSLQHAVLRSHVLTPPPPLPRPPCVAPTARTIDSPCLPNRHLVKTTAPLQNTLSYLRQCTTITEHTSTFHLSPTSPYLIDLGARTITPLEIGNAPVECLRTINTSSHGTCSLSNIGD